MKAAVGLLLMLLLLGVSHAVETQCDGRQDGAQCYGALGGTLVLQLVDSASDIYRFRLVFNTKTILDVKENKILSNLLESRSIFTPSDGTFRINDLSRSDGGNYTLNTFDYQGKNTETRTLQLFIQAPVSSVLVIHDCLSQGELKMFCDSEGGDSPEYSWTLDGRRLTDDKLLPGNNQTNTIILKQDVSGLLTCSVKNNVSLVSDQVQISTCGFIYIDCYINGTHISKWVYAANNTLCIPSPTTTTAVPDTTVGKETNITVSVKPSDNFTSIIQPPSISSDLFYIIMAGALSALLILLVVGVAVIYTQKKKKGNAPAEEADEQELTYADVRILQRQTRQVKQKEEVEVEYGQVKFSGRPRQTAEPAGNDCVYATVRR